MLINKGWKTFVFGCFVVCIYQCLFRPGPLFKHILTLGVHNDFTKAPTLKFINLGQVEPSAKWIWQRDPVCSNYIFGNHNAHFWEFQIQYKLDWFHLLIVTTFFIVHRFKLAIIPHGRFKAKNRDIQRKHFFCKRKCKIPRKSVNPEVPNHQSNWSFDVKTSTRCHLTCKPHLRRLY